MLELDSLFSIILAFFIVTVSPGPANIALATIAMNSGRKVGLLFGAGLSLGLAFWGIVAATGMGAVLQGSATLLFALKIFGGIYLLWLAFQSSRSAFMEKDSKSNVPDEGRWFMRGLVLNLSNPKAVVAWMVALSTGLGSSDSIAQVIGATLICMALGAVNYTGYALAFSRPNFMNGYKRLRRWIDGAVAGLFCLAGFGLIRSAFSQLNLK